MKRNMQLYVNPRSAVLALLSALALSACGSGGGGGAPSSGGTTSTTVPSNTGSVTANFVATASGSRAWLAAPMYQGNIAAANFVQAAGAMTTLGSYTLSGNPAVTQDISGDANYAMGRWVWGTVTNTSTNTVLDTMPSARPGDAWHYVMFNSLPTLPTTGVKVCDNGTFTTPTYVSGATAPSPALTGVTTGSAATLSFTAAGGQVAFTLATTAGGSTNTTNFSAANLTAGTTGLSGTMSAGGTYAWIILTDGGAGAVRITGVHSVTLPNGLNYDGVYSFKCI
jgi:hypothetical protein